MIAPESDDGLLSADDQRRWGDRLIGDDLILVPIRHHSPACAAAVSSLIETRRPSVVIIEGPPSFAEFVPLLSHPDAQFPLAIYCHTQLKPTVAGAEPVHLGSYYPLAECSPELWRCSRPNAIGADVIFADLEYSERVSGDEPGAGGADGQSLLAEHHLARSQTLPGLRNASAVGTTTSSGISCLNRSSGPVEDLVASVGAFGAVTRAHFTPDDLAADLSLLRESRMIAPRSLRSTDARTRTDRC